MTIREVKYRPSVQQGWIKAPFPGPSQLVPGHPYPTSTTYCTCGHNGPSHRRQTVTRAPYGTQANPWRYKGDCTSQDTAHGRQCPCTWYTESGMSYTDMLVAVLNRDRKVFE